MSTQGNIAVEAEMRHLLKLMDDVKHLPPDEQLTRMRKKIEETRDAAASGWL